MKKKPKRIAPPIPLPPLSVDAFLEVERIEQAAKQILGACDDFGFNLEKARRCLNTLALPAFTAQLHHYQSLPSFDTRWFPELRDNVIASLLGLLPPGGRHHASALEPDLTSLIDREMLSALNRRKEELDAPKANRADDTAEIRRQKIDEFIGMVLAEGRSVSRTEIWRMAGYTNRTEFERYQRCAKPANKRAVRLFNAILALSAKNFIERLDKLAAL
jgi:hypothetical protein